MLRKGSRKGLKQRQGGFGLRGGLRGCPPSPFVVFKGRPVGKPRFCEGGTPFFAVLKGRPAHRKLFVRGYPFCGFERKTTKKAIFEGCPPFFVALKGRPAQRKLFLRLAPLFCGFERKSSTKTAIVEGLFLVVLKGRPAGKPLFLRGRHPKKRHTHLNRLRLKTMDEPSKSPGTT